MRSFFRLPDLEVPPRLKEFSRPAAGGGCEFAGRAGEGASEPNPFRAARRWPFCQTHLQSSQARSRRRRRLKGNENVEKATVCPINGRRLGRAPVVIDQEREGSGVKGK